MACNLRHDERISPAREAVVDNHEAPGVLPHPRTGAALKGVVNDYFWRRVRTSFYPDYIVPELSSDNFVPVATAAVPGINGSMMLGRLLDSSRLRTVYEWAFEQEIYELLDFEPAAGDKPLGDWLKRRLASPEETDAFLHAVLNVMDLRRNDHPLEPAWAFWWHDFEAYRHELAERWLQVLGLENRHSDDLPHWLVLLRYYCRDVGTLIRPTQLDAGWYRHHFPSPRRDEPAQRRGHPMDLGAPSRGYRLLAEFIHQQIPHAGHWTGDIKQTVTRVTAELRDQRHAHYLRLRDEYPEVKSGGWIEECL